MDIKWNFERSSGVLMPVSALPSGYGIGSFDKEAYAFVDFLSEAGQKYWQVLPLGPTSHGDSPYQNFSAFAGNPYFIGLITLIEEGLLNEDECSNNCGDKETEIDYLELYLNRFEILKIAYSRFCTDEEYSTFCKENHWLEDYSVFMALKTEFGGDEWQKWPDELRRRQPEALEEIKIRLAQEIGFWKFCQFKFFQQWKRLKDYANAKGVYIIGDIPIYVAMDSADTWTEPKVFYLDSELKPIDVAGCPPDAFSPTGQLWGNPLYRWDYQISTQFAWWKRRLKQTAALYDVVRIDHFRGLESYYAIPAGNTTAEGGEWRKGPGLEFFEAVTDSMSDVKLILEDLGFLTEEVNHLLRQVGAPGMKVLQFAFDLREESDYLPHNYVNNSVVYTGTHDNDTIVGWMNTASKRDTQFAKKYLNITDETQCNWAFIRAAYASVSSLAIIPLQDFLGLGSEARINTPSTIGNNWKWRMEKNALTGELATKIRELKELYCR